MRYERVMSDQIRWCRIRVAPLPVSRSGANFASAIARAADLPLTDAVDVVEEYLRFLYLCAITDRPRVAPPLVRLAWRLHAQSPEYAAFCAGTLGKSLVFDDNTRQLSAARAYDETLAAYRAEFRAEPLDTVWPETVQSRLPRWGGLHLLILGFAAALAFGRGEPLLFAVGLGLSLMLYGVDLLLLHRGRLRGGFGDAASDDLSFWLHREGSG